MWHTQFFWCTSRVSFLATLLRCSLLFSVFCVWVSRAGHSNTIGVVSRQKTHLSPFFPKHSGGCAPEAFVVAKQPSAALSVTRRCGALAAFWKVEMFLSRCGADAPGKNERVAPRPRRFHYERAYRASTFEITNLSAQKTRYVSGP